MLDMISAGQVGGNTQTEEGLQHIYQSIAYVRRALGALEEMGESIDSANDQLTAVQLDLQNVHQAMN